MYLKSIIGVDFLTTLTALTTSEGLKQWLSKCILVHTSFQVHEFFKVHENF